MFVKGPEQQILYQFGQLGVELDTLQALYELIL